ncbi:NADPH-dependent diflavin oxidoreductase 1 [Culicoides brevitarsis]|uniref:NADPH-dependent diflavin oxidoreductase 1 n=1 Tax=Culicoides brevitarsis TaxID=469753 RepID=UPI00307B4878
MEERKFTVLYGSETGTAQDLSEHIWRESKKYGFKGKVLPMDDYNPLDLITEQCVLFVCATAGQGEEPENMKKFWKFLLRRSLAADSLSHVHVAVLCLGDSSFPKFNWVGKRLSKRLLQLGAREIIPIGLCDDQHDMGIAAVYVPFVRDMFQKMLLLYPMPAGQTAETKPRQFKWNVRVMENVSAETDKIWEHLPMIRSCKVLENTRTTHESHFQDVRFIRLEKQDLNWLPGDVACIRPQNSKESLKKLFDLFDENNLGLRRDTVISVTEVDSELPVPSYLAKSMTLETIATKYWDLNTIPRPRFFELLALNCENELELEKLKEFASPEGLDDLYSYANRPKRTVLETLVDFPHACSKLNIEVLFEMFQPIKARSFSISSCVESGSLALLVAVVEYRTMLKAPRKGFCSNWLKDVEVNDEVPVWIKRGTFRLPENRNTPLVMVGPGTGLAPFLSILCDRKINGDSGPLLLFFGCRNESMDFHCRDRLQELQKSGMLQLICAFSRDQEDKMYVQNRIRENGDLLRKFLQKDQGYFFVSGSMKQMPQCVKEALEEVLTPDYVKAMIDSGRYQEECW